MVSILHVCKMKSSCFVDATVTFQHLLQQCSDVIKISYTERIFMLSSMEAFQLHKKWSSLLKTILVNVEYFKIGYDCVPLTHLVQTLIMISVYKVKTDLELFMKTCIVLQNLVKTTERGVCNMSSDVARRHMNSLHELLMCVMCFPWPLTGRN